MTETNGSFTNTIGVNGWTEVLTYSIHVNGLGTVVCMITFMSQIPFVLLLEFIRSKRFSLLMLTELWSQTVTFLQALLCLPKTLISTAPSSRPTDPTPVFFRYTGHCPGLKYDVGHSYDWVVRHLAEVRHLPRLCQLLLPVIRNGVSCSHWWLLSTNY